MKDRGFSTIDVWIIIIAVVLIFTILAVGIFAITAAIRPEIIPHIIYNYQYA